MDSGTLGRVSGTEGLLDCISINQGRAPTSPP